MRLEDAEDIGKRKSPFFINSSLSFQWLLFAYLELSFWLFIDFYCILIVVHSSLFDFSLIRFAYLCFLLILHWFVLSSDWCWLSFHWCFGWRTFHFDWLVIDSSNLLINCHDIFIYLLLNFVGVPLIFFDFSLTFMVFWFILILNSFQTIVVGVPLIFTNFVHSYCISIGVHWLFMCLSLIFVGVPLFFT